VKARAGIFANGQGTVRTCFGLIVLMLASSLSPMIGTAEQPAWALIEEDQSTGFVEFFPSENTTFVDAEISDALVIDANRTFTDAQLSVQPIWGSSATNGTNFGVYSTNQWNGTHDQTNGIGHGGHLTLATEASLGTVSDFETTVRTASGWLGVGDDHEAWAIVQPSLRALNSQSGMDLPSNGSGSASSPSTPQSLSALSTRGTGDLEANMTGCIQSPSYQTPSFINNYTLFFRHWLALNTDDAAWVEIKSSTGQWVAISPIDGYNATSTHQESPLAVWNGEQAAWTNATFQLDSTISAIQESVELKFCYATGVSQGLRGGWFVDELLLHNQGDEPGAWFHGNLSGNYLPNAEGQLALSLDFMNHTGQTVELELSSNWDIEGGAQDYLTVWISFDNGSTYSPISTHPGHPNNGAQCDGVFFNGPDSSDRWCPVLYSLPWNTTSPQNASSVHLRFWVQTNANNNFGGTSSNGWEGVAIDDISVWTNRGMPSQTKTTLANFTTQPSQNNGSSDGWLTYDGTAPNEWNWSQSFGNNGASSNTEGFETGFELPAGWSLEATSNRRWEVGPTSNASGYGPGIWHSGTGGAGIYLDDEYRNNMLTHLYTPEYTLPVNSTARLTFRSWVCTEASWDGGAVSISTDGGENWWFLPPTLNGFHDQISTVNSYSPLYGEGIIDGSNVAGGCENTIRGFDLKTFDLSNLSGMEVRARFTFFSDQLIELDGWYIDDAGIEIDLYEPEGTWTSAVISPDPVFGWGQIDGFVEQPENTSLLFDVLDANGQIIQGFTNRTLPIPLPLDPMVHASLQLRANFATNQTLLTPSIQRLTVGAVHYYDAYHHQRLPLAGVGLDAVFIDQDSRLVSGGSASAVWSYEAMCPFQSITIVTYGDNLSATHAGYALDSWTYSETEPPSLRRTLSSTSTPGFTASLALTWPAGAASNGFVYEPHCSLEPKAPMVTIGQENTSLFEWPVDALSTSFGFAKGLHDTDLIPGTTVENGTLHIENTGTQFVNLSWMIPGDSPHASAAMNHQVQFLVELESNGTDGLFSLQQSGPSRTIAVNDPAQHHRLTHSASCLRVEDNAILHTVACTVQVLLNGTFSATVSQAVMVPSHQMITRSVPHLTLNDAADAFRLLNASASVVLPLRITTHAGSIAVNLSATSQPLLVDRILPISHQRWLPEETVIFETQHWRGDANQPTLDAPDLTSVELMLSPSKLHIDALVHLEVINVDSTPQFRQLDGVAYAHLISNGSSIACSINVCNITWMVKSTWAFDDIDDVHVLSSATDINGLSTGPAHAFRQTGFNEIENDLEVVGFTVLDANQRDLNDWSNPQWPFHLNADQSMVASGAVRFEGVAQSFVDAGEAQVRIEARAVPPINVSGGPNEWPGPAVNWSASWLAEVNQNGAFSVSIATPSMDEILPSGTRIHLTPHLERRGPVDDQSPSSLDQTSPSSHVPFIYDRVRPNTIALLALDPGGYSPADNHLWMKGQDVALRVTLEDQEGLSNSLELHTWLESSDDTNFDGVMDASEYSSQTVTFNSGLTEAVVDLPLLSWIDITGGASSGRASVVIRATDLAGNMLQGGGEYGEAFDLGTIFVQERYDTLIDTSTMTFDDVNGSLLLGHEHAFQFTVTDGNGIASLDEIELALLGRDASNTCFIRYMPRFETTEADGNCFETHPIVVVQQIGLQQSWTVEIKFRLAWNLSNGVDFGASEPSLKLFDEGQDLGLGLSKLGVFSWSVASALAVQSIVFEDQTSPVGETGDGHLWVHRNDLVNLTLYLVHANTTIVAEHVPDTVEAEILLSDGERSVLTNASFDVEGRAHTQLLMDEQILQHNTGFIDVIIEGDLLQYDQRFDLTLDRFSPQLAVPPGTLAVVDSNALDAQEVIVILTDQEGLSDEPLMMHWRFLRVGEALDGSSGSVFLPKSAGGGTTNTYSGQVDLRPQATTLLEQEDRLEVWFSASDRSGRIITGHGTSESPLTPSFRWVAFEPRFDDLVVTPYSPIVGENISVFVRVANEGLLPGNVTVQLKDSEGRILESNASQLQPGTWVEHRWSVETWTTGYLGLKVSIVNVTGDIPLPMGRVSDSQENSQGGVDALGFAVLVVILAAGVLGFSLYRRRETMAEFTRQQVDKAMLDRSLPPPRPKDLDDLAEEQ
jgi:hypothetical protein